MSDVIREEVTQAHEFSAISASVLAVDLSSNTNEMPPESEKGSDAGHGNRFQSKLLMLFCIRAINAGYKFYLGTELLDQGNKFDDLIFKYSKNKNAENTEDNWPYQYLQAKSRLKEKDDKITAKDLFSVPAKGKTVNVDFSLPKYFRSYCEITRRGDKIDSCIICTNIDFANKKSLRGNGIEVTEVQLDDPILKFEKLSNEKIPTRYKIKVKGKGLSGILKEETASKLLAKKLCGKKPLNSKSEVIRNYHMALVKENVINLVTNKFHEDFINGSNELSEGAKELRHNFLKLFKNDNDWKNLIFKFDNNFGKLPLQPEIFNYTLPIAVKDEEIDGFFDKLIFAVNTPNEGELDDVLKGEVGNYFKLLVSDLQSAYVMNEMINWFKRENNVWLSSEEAKELFLNKTQTIMESIRVNEISIDYQSQLKKDLMGLEFNSDSIQVMTEKLKLLLEDSSSMVMIDTESPHHTAVKLIAAIKIHPDFKCDDSFLVTPSKRLEDEAEINKLKNCLELKKDSHTLLIVVCDGDVSIQNYMKYANLVSGRRTDDKINKVVIVCPDKTAKITDEIKYMDLTDEFKQKILSLKVSFQLQKGSGQKEMENNRITIGDLIGDKPEDVIDFSSIKELTKTGYEVKIPSFDDTTHFEENMYIKRQLKFPFHHKFEDELAKSLDCTVNQLREECRICPNGHIEWLVEDKRQKEIWKKIQDVVKHSPSSDVTPEHHLIRCQEDEKEKPSVVIISGVAGTGKSTILSHYCRGIKRVKPDCWVIKMNLMDHCKEILKLDKITRSNTFDFLVNHLHVVDDKSSFSHSLFKKRLETGDRIIFMFDGFDEINDQCQEKAIQLMKSITEEKSTGIQLFVTTRPHMLDKLQFQLSQLAYSLQNFNEKAQIDYLVSYWKKKLNLLADYDGSLQQFAKSLVERVSETLKDKERSFIGVPLQCRIMAECYQSELQEKVKKSNKDNTEQSNFEYQPLANVDFDLNSLYKLLMEKKRRVFREEKVNSSNNQNELLIDAVNRLIEDIESHLIKLAIETLVTDKKSLDILWTSQSSHYQLESEKIQKEKRNNELGVKYGLIIFKEGDGEEEGMKTQFLHRTFAEYLLAKYLYEGIAITHCDNNRLLDKESVRDLIANQILVVDDYDGVRVFFNAMLKETINSKEWLRVISEGKQVLPVRLQNFTSDMALQITKQVTFDLEKCPGVLPSRSVYRPNPLAVAVYTGNENIYNFLCDCLDTALEKIDVRHVFRYAFEKYTFSFKTFYFVSSGLFQRFIEYYDDADYLEITCITHQMLQGLMSTQFTLESYLRIWNKKEAKEIVKMLLDFIEKHKTVYVNEVLSLDEFARLSRGHKMVQMLHFFTFNEYYDSLFDPFFRLLSSMCLNDGEFANLLKYTLRLRDENNNNWAYPSNSGIEKTLIALRDLGRNKVMEGLSHLALVWDKQVFDKFYQPSRPDKDEDSSDLQLLLERDSSRMTRLHRAAFYGEAEIVDDTIKTIRNHLSSATNRPLAVCLVQDIMLARTHECFTPFYVAAATGHNEICHKILSFLKEILGADHIREGLIAYHGFLHRAMWDAILFKNIPMFEVILEAVNQALGQHSLLVLLKSSNPETSKSSTNRSLAKYDKDLFKIIGNILLQNGRKKGYEGLNDLALHTDPCLINSWANIERTLENIENETLKEMLAVIGIKNWTKRVLDLGISRAFRFLSSHLLARFTSQQRSRFVEAITSPHTQIIPSNPVELSYWAEWLAGDEFTADDFDCLDKLLECIADNQTGQSCNIQKLLFNDNGKDCTRALLHQNIKIVSIVSKHLSRTDQLKIKKFVRRNGPEIIDELSHYLKPFENRTRRRQVLRYWVNILPFYQDTKERIHFEKLVSTLLFLRTEKQGKAKIQYSFWSRYLDSYDDQDGNKVEMVGKFLKCVSEKLGKEAVKKVVLHKDCMGIVLLGAEFQENQQLVNVMLNRLSDLDRDCINLLIMKNSPFNSRRYKSQRSAELCQCKPMNSCACWC